MPKQILIEEIKIDRELKDGDDLSDLDAAETWPPIVVNENYELIDGLRRIRSAERSGLKKIRAHVISTLEEASDALAEQHTTPMKDWDRVYELLHALRPYINARWQRIRANNIRRITGKDLEPVPSRGPSRPIVTRALGGTSSSHWEIIERIYEGKLAPEYLEDVRAGRLTPSGAFNRAHRAPKQGEVTDPQDQQVLITATAQFMSQAVRSLERLAWPITATSEDLAEPIEQIRRARAKITGFLNRQSEEAESK